MTKPLPRRHIFLVFPCHLLPRRSVVLVTNAQANFLPLISYLTGWWRLERLQTLHFCFVPFTSFHWSISSLISKTCFALGNKVAFLMKVWQHVWSTTCHMPLIRFRCHLGARNNTFCNVLRRLPQILRLSPEKISRRKKIDQGTTVCCRWSLQHVVPDD